MITFSRLCLPAALLVFGACSLASNEPAPPIAPPLRPGIYTFLGSFSIVDTYEGRTVRTPQTVSGSFEVREDGTVSLTSSHGSCTAGRMRDGYAISQCGERNWRLGPAQGTVGISVVEDREVRSRNCAEYRMTNGSDPSQRTCVRYQREVQRVRVEKSPYVRVSRAS